LSLHEWRRLALGAPRALGDADATGILRATPEDFVVEEDLGFAPDGDGAHLLLKVRKRNANTGWVAQELARGLGCQVRDIGFAGLKDRRAVALQWFSLPVTARALEAAAGFMNPEFAVLEVHRHRRKLPRGALAGNAFVIRIRDYTGSAAGLRERCEAILAYGVPNYFGPQRFGREAGNLGRLAESRPGRPESFVLSAARSLVFNAVVGQRVRAGSWGSLAAGDVANLDGRGSVFKVDEVASDLAERLARLEVHPTGPMWGSGELMSAGPVREMEERVGQELAHPCQYVVDAGLRQERRSVRLKVRDLRWEQDADGVLLRFWLRSGSFATAVLREILADPPTADHSVVLDADDA
jgi:tRNA pseudouridine13 synthase